METKNNRAMNVQRTVAIVGASADRSKYGNKAVRAYLAQGWQVFPVNAKGGEIEGLRVYSSLETLPARVDRVSLYLPPTMGLKLLPAIAKLRPIEFFVNPGAESDPLVEAARTLGLDPILACSIVEVGISPSALPDV
ncbi:MAG: CoA-binding protein [Phycisphaerales bacterium]|nr:CoA-binding protein [Phycisphaerales bacterium]